MCTRPDCNGKLNISKRIIRLCMVLGALALTGCGGVQEAVVDAVRASAKESLERTFDETIDENVDGLMNDLFDIDELFGGQEQAGE